MLAKHSIRSLSADCGGDGRPADNYGVKTKVVVAAAVDASLLDRLDADERFDVIHGDDFSDAEIVVTRTTNRVTRELLERAPRLRAIAQATSGIDNIDAAAARERGVAVLHLPGINANAVAELVIGFAIALTRTIPLYTRDVSSGVWNRDDCTSRHELSHYRLGIAGLGHAGSCVARLASAFSMPVAAFDPYLDDGDFRERGAVRRPSLEALLESSDIATMHVPLTAETRGMIGARELQRMPAGSFLINTARGEVVDTGALLAALARGHLGGAALDVHDPEPPRRSFPDDPRLILTPHIAGCTYECRQASGERLYHRIVEWLET